MDDVTETERRAFAHHVLVDTAHRFVFFSIPKVACTEWLRVFMRLQGVDDWRADPHYRTDRPLLSQFSTQECTEILASAEWYKAVFVRDPVDRLLSAYLDKFVHRRSYIVQQFVTGENELSLDQFVDLVVDPNTDPDRPEGVHRGTNPHWRPQSMVGGLGRFVDQLDFVGRFDRLHDDATSLLTRLGLWESIGRRGWGADGDRALFETNEAEHRTDAALRVSSLLTPDQVARIQHAYRDDVQLFEQLGVGDVIRHR